MNCERCGHYFKTLVLYKKHRHCIISTCGAVLCDDAALKKHMKEKHLWGE